MEQTTELTYNEKRLLAVLKPLKDAEMKKQHYQEKVASSISDNTLPIISALKPLKDILSALEEKKNIALNPIRNAVNMLESGSDEKSGFSLKKLSLARPSVKYLAIIMDTSEEAVVQYAKLLDSRGYCKLIADKTVAYAYTEEGAKYAKEGLPERLLYDSFDNSIALKDLQANPSAKLGIGWLRKKGWVTIKDGIAAKVGNVPLGADELALKDLSVKSAGTEELLKRKLITEDEITEYYIEITKEGEDLVEKGLDLRIETSTLTAEQIRTGEWTKLKLRNYNVQTPPKRIFAGKKHPYQQLIDEMRGILISMGFTEMYGSVIQSSFWNFDALFQPQDHPAREMQDTFFLDMEAELPPYYKAIRDIHEHGGDTSSTGWGGKWSEEKAKQCVLRTHTTGLSIQYLKDHPHDPLKVFCIGRVYRREAIDPTHTPEFEQLEGIVMDSDVSFRHLMGFLKEFYQRMGFTNVRFRPAYFPYTEPSVEPEVYVDGLGWVELGGAGIFREEVTAPWGVKYPVLAWGLGISRVAMLKMGLKDLRQLYRSDVDWIRSVPMNRNEIKATACGDTDERVANKGEE